MLRIGAILYHIIRVSMDTRATAHALAKQLRYQCEGSGDILLNKDTLRLVLDAFIEDWGIMQGKIRQSFEKVK